MQGLLAARDAILKAIVAINECGFNQAASHLADPIKCHRARRERSHPKAMLTTQTSAVALDLLEDRTFDFHNQLVYGRGMHFARFGFYGDRILVNGRPDFRIDVSSRAYRLRVMNASNARIYKLAWDDGTPIVVIGVDRGLRNVG
jgi:FtsP/CotA-like multicopper oxidase with cupredoxin domain